MRWATTLAVLCVAATLPSGCGDSSSAPSAGRTTRQAHPHARSTTTATVPHSRKVRNATPQANWHQHLGPVPILVYHELGIAPASAPYPGLYVSRANFAAEMRCQLVASHRFLQHTFHIPVNSFCYPSSRYNATVIAAVKAAGYTNALTENNGYATRTNPYLLN